jgi:hypothetical protein
MKFNPLILLLLVFGLSSCEDTESTSTKPTSLTVIKSANYPLPQPVLMRDNLPNERGNNRVDSLQWQLLSMQGLSPFSTESGYFILGKIKDTPGEFTSILLYEENPGYTRAWMANYNQTGAILDYRLVYYQRSDGKVTHSGYLEDNVLEIKKTTTNIIKYQLLPSGQFVPM